MREPTAIEWYRGKNVCVTGATGLIGSYVVAVLKASGAHVRAVGGMARGGGEWPVEGARFDLMNPADASTAVSGCEIVVGCAGVTGGIGLVTHDPLSYVGKATAMVINTLDACVAEKVERFGFLSSTTVYPPSDESVKEGFETTGPPYELYWGIGESKRFLEKLCRYYHERAGLKVAVVRPSGAYGRYDNFDERTSHVVPALLQRAINAEAEMEVWGDGGDVRDIVHAQDVARGLLLAVSRSEDADPFNIASGRGVTTRQLAEAALRAAGSSAKIVTRPDKPTALRTRLVDIGKARNVLGFEPEVSLEDGLADTLEWFRTSR